MAHQACRQHGDSTGVRSVYDACFQAAGMLRDDAAKVGSFVPIGIGERYRLSLAEGRIDGDSAKVIAALKAL